MRIEVDGRQTNLATGGVAVVGGQPLVLLLHGAGMDRTVWNLQTRYLAHRGYTALAVDFPGHGGSAGPPAASVAELAEWTGRLVDALAMGPAHLVGHSMGSLVAMEVAAARPAIVTSLVLLGTASAMPVHPDLQRAAEQGDLLAPELMTAWAHGTRSHVTSSPTPGLWMIGGGQALLERAAPGVIANDLAACNAYDAGDIAARIGCPVTVVVGEADRMTPPRAAAALVAGFDAVEVVHLPDVGHMMMTEAPAEIREVLDRALP